MACIYVCMYEKEHDNRRISHLSLYGLVYRDDVTSQDEPQRYNTRYTQRFREKLYSDRWPLDFLTMFYWQTFHTLYDTLTHYTTTSDRHTHDWSQFIPIYGGKRGGRNSLRGTPDQTRESSAWGTSTGRSSSQCQVVPYLSDLEWSGHWKWSHIMVSYIVGCGWHVPQVMVCHQSTQTDGTPKLSDCDKELDVVSQDHGTVVLGMGQPHQFKGQSSHFFDLFPVPGTISWLETVRRVVLLLDTCQKQQQSWYPLHRQPEGFSILVSFGNPEFWGIRLG